MSTTEPPTTEVPPQSPPPSGEPPRRSWGSRLRRRGVIVTAAVVALVVVAGVTAALLWPGHERGRFIRHGEPMDRSWGAGPWGAGMGGPGAPGFEGRGGPGGWGPGFGGPHGDGPGRPGDEGHTVRPGGADQPSLTGTVAAVADGSITVNVDGGAPRTLRTDDSTAVRGAGNSALGDLQTGERVLVTVEGTGDAAVARAVWTPQAQVVGTVTALSGNTATVTSVEGLTVSVDVTALSQKPVVGDVARFSGVAADGGTIRADGIRILPKAS